MILLTGLFKTGFKKESWLRLCTQAFLTAAEGSVRKTYYKRDFTFLSSHFYITRYGYLTRNKLKQETNM